MVDKLQELGDKIKRLSEQVESMRAFGLNDKLLVSWLCHNLKISQSMAKKFLQSQESFFNELIKSETLKKLEDKEI